MVYLSLSRSLFFFFLFFGGGGHSRSVIHSGYDWKYVCLVLGLIYLQRGIFDSSFVINFLALIKIELKWLSLPAPL